MMKTRKILALVLSLVMVLSLCGSAFAAHLTNEVTELEAQNSDTSLYLATQGYVLLENNGALPFKGTFPIAYFGSGSETTIKGGTGSGDVNQRAHDNIGDAFIAAGYEVANPTWYAKMAEQVQQRSILGARPKLDMAPTRSWRRLSPMPTQLSTPFPGTQARVLTVIPTQASAHITFPSLSAPIWKR